MKMRIQMKGLLARASLATALIFSVPAVHGQSRTGEAPVITLETNPQQVQAGQEFEMIWKVSAEDAQILDVFVDCGGAMGPEFKWQHDGDGDFLMRVNHLEESSGLKEYEIWVKCKKGQAYRHVGESFKLKIADKGGDKDLKDFLSWMKEVGYSDEVIKVYGHDGLNPIVRKEWDKYFAMRKEESAYRDLETMPVVFIDLLATDEDAVNEPLVGQTDKLQEYLTYMFGKAFEVEYLEQRVSYEAEFGKPLLQSNDKGQKWLKFNPATLNKFARETARRVIKERNLPPNSVIIRWAPQKWMHEGEMLSIQDHTGSGPAISGMDFRGFGIATYAHEWGHGLGLGHMFVNGPGSYSSRAWGLECIMNHTYVGYSNREVGRLLSPIPRYALEPKDGYLDQKTFASTYSEAMAGTDHLNRRLDGMDSAPTAVSSMTWSTPWNPSGGDSVLCQGYKNRNLEVKKLELEPGIEPGIYTLYIDKDSKTGSQWTMDLFKDGRKLASTRVAWMTRINHANHYTLAFKDHFSLVIGRTE